jgi:hypothetical protein
MTALGVLLAEPAIQVVLLQLIQRGPVAVEPPGRDARIVLSAS